MIPITRWTLRLWIIDIAFVNKGMWLPGGFNIWRFNFSFLSSKYFVGKRKLDFFRN